MKITSLHSGTTQTVVTDCSILFCHSVLVTEAQVISATPSLNAVDAIPIQQGIFWLFQDA